MPEKPCAVVYPISFEERCLKAGKTASQISRAVIPMKEVCDINAKEEGKKITRHEFFLAYNNVSKFDDEIAVRSAKLDALFEFTFAEFDGRMVDIAEKGEMKAKRVVVSKTVKVLHDDDLSSLAIYHEEKKKSN